MEKMRGILFIWLILLGGLDNVEHQNRWAQYFLVNALQRAELKRETDLDLLIQQKKTNQKTRNDSDKLRA